MKVNHEKTDVLVVGAGLAGTRAAIAARVADPGVRVAIAAPAFPGQGGCGPETHGVNAAVFDGDSPELHFKDTLAGGAFLNQEPLARVLCERSPREVEFLAKEGVPFDHLLGSDDGDFDVAGRYGGSSFDRSLHWRDMTGRAISHALQLRLLREGATVLPRHWLLGLLTAGGRCEGGIFLDTGWDEILVVRSGVVILATGGGACMYPARSMPPDKAVTGIASAMRLGAPAIDMEMVQFHPTGFRNDDGPGNGALLEEEFRTQGATLTNPAGERFMERYDERGELATRDVVSRAIYQEMMASRDGDVPGTVLLHLDSFREEQLIGRFPNTIRRLGSYGFDLLKHSEVPVVPSSHFLMGGIAIDTRANTGIPGLLCCGEDAGGVHGANRLGGNGVADALVFGGIAGEEAARLARADRGGAFASLAEMDPVQIAVAEPAVARHVLGQIRQLMWEHCSPVRTVTGLAELRLRLDELRGWSEHEFHTPAALGRSLAGRKTGALIAVAKVDNIHLISRTIAAAASWRRNSAGSHFLASANPDWESAQDNSCVRLGSGSDGLKVGSMAAPKVLPGSVKRLPLRPAPATGAVSHTSEGAPEVISADATTDRRAS
jgi:succinate dehydrogenase/fumarate reductase flavoprotein subunit